MFTAYVTITSLLLCDEGQKNMLVEAGGWPWDTNAGWIGGETASLADTFSSP